MKITKKWLGNNRACWGGLKWYDENNLRRAEHTKLINMLVDDGEVFWSFWLISRLLNLRHNSRWACNSARLVLPIFESEKPHDNSARKCIECAESSASTQDELYAAIGAVEEHSKDVLLYVIESDAWCDAEAAAQYAAQYAARSTSARADPRYSAAEAAKHAAQYADLAAMSAARAYHWAANSDADIGVKIIDFGLKLIKEQADENN